MTIRAFMQIVRRWIVVVAVGALLAAGAGAAAFLLTSRTYEVSARYLFLSSGIDAQGRQGNPFLDIGNGIGVLIETVSVSMLDGQTVRRFSSGDSSVEYTIARDTTVSAPVMLITVTADTGIGAFSVLDSLGTEASNRSHDFQVSAGAGEALLVRDTLLTRSLEAKADYVAAIRNGAVVALGIFVATMALVLILDRRAARRGGLEALQDQQSGIVSPPHSANRPGPGIGVRNSPPARPSRLGMTVSQSSSSQSSSRTTRRGADPGYQVPSGRQRESKFLEDD